MSISARTTLYATVLSLSVFAGSPSIAQAMEQQIDFDDYSRCDFGPNLEALLTIAGSEIQISRMLQSEARPPAGFEFGDTLHSYIYPSAGSRWHGLTLILIERETGIESGPYNVSLIFAEPPEIARPLLNQIGFDLPASGQHRVIDDEVIESGVQFGPHLEGSMLTCYSD